MKAADEAESIAPTNAFPFRNFGSPHHPHSPASACGKHRTERSGGACRGTSHRPARPAQRPPRLITAAQVRPSLPTWKRLLDILFVLLSLPLTLPLTAAVILWIKLVSNGPALLRQERVGLHGKRFVLYKLRSMRMNADPRPHERHFQHLVRSDRPMVKLEWLHDPRLIMGGAFLRITGLDELPQLINILRGEMSVVGPRPCLPGEFRFFSPDQRERFKALPGLTGIWQVHGKGVSTFNEMNLMDALYVRNPSLLLDIAIIVQTPLALLRQLRQAHHIRRVAAIHSNPGHSPVDALPGLVNRSLG